MMKIKIQKKQTDKPHSLPSEIRAQGMKILENKLKFSKIELEKLEASINKETFNILDKEGLPDLNMHDLRAQRVYDQILRKVCIHLDPDSPVNNTYLLDTVDRGLISLEEIPRLSPLKLHPESWKRQVDNQQVEAMQVAAGTKRAESSIIKCGKCGGNATYTESQKRSADEAMDIDAECVKCGHKWTQ